MIDWSIAQEQLNYIDDPSEKSHFILSDIYAENHVPVSEQVGLFIGVITPFTNAKGKTNYAIKNITTLMDKPINTNPYSLNPLSVFLSPPLKKGLSANDNVVFSVVIGLLGKPTELLTAKDVYTFSDLGINGSLSCIERAKALLECHKLSYYQDALLRFVNANTLYEVADRINELNDQLKHKNDELQEQEQQLSNIKNIIADLQNEKLQLEKDSDEHRILIAQLPNLRDEKQELDAILPSLREEKEKCDVVIRQHDKLVDEIDKLTEEKKKLNADIPALRKEKEQLSDYLIKYFDVKDQYEKMVAKLRPDSTEKTSISYDYLSWTPLTMSKKGSMTSFKKRLGYAYDDTIIQKFLLALNTSQIITLCGDPGTGKTTFVNEMSEALGAVCHMIEVQNNWTDKSDILGYYNPLDGGKYQSTAFLDALLEAKLDYENNGEKTRLHIICLDEMNLARVEYYFATFLSLLQQEPSKRIISLLPHDLDNLAEDDSSAIHAYHHFILPPNVRFVGTLNMDDSAQSLSPKVIDRCFFIEFEKGNGAPQKAERKTSYYPASEFAEDSSIAAPSESNETGPFIHIKKENPRMRHYAHQMFITAQKLGITENVFADIVVSSKVLPRIKQVAQYQDYLQNPLLILSNDRFKKFDTYGENNQYCDYWRKR